MAFARAGVAGDWSGDPPPLQWGDDLGAITSQSLLFDQVREFLVRETASPAAHHRAGGHALVGPGQPRTAAPHRAATIDSLPLLLIATYRDDEMTPREPLFDAAAASGALPITSSGSISGRLPSTPIQALVTRRYALSEDDRGAVGRLSPDPLGRQRLLSDGVAARAGSRSSAATIGRSAGSWGSWSGRLCRDWSARSSKAGWPRSMAEILELLEIAAVIGQDVPLDIWEAASGSRSRSPRRGNGERARGPPDPRAVRHDESQFHARAGPRDALPPPDTGGTAGAAPARRRDPGEPPRSTAERRRLALCLRRRPARHRLARPLRRAGTGALRGPRRHHGADARP